MPPNFSLKAERNVASSLFRRNPVQTHPTNTATSSFIASAFRLAKRQQQQQGVDNRIIPAYYSGQNGMSPGVVIAIVLGSVLGFLLILWLIRSVIGGGGFVNSTTTMAGEEEIVVRNPPSNHGRRHSHHSRRSTRSEMRESSRSPRRSHIIVDDRPPPSRARSRSIVVDDRYARRVPNDDIIEVEEFGPPRRASRAARSSRDYR